MGGVNVGIVLLVFLHFAGGSTFTFPWRTDFTKELGCTPLRILCVGDSITQGSLSSAGDGYRGFLQSMLVNATNGGAYGADVDFVGTLRKGNMTDNSHEGKSGAYLSDLVPVVQGAIASRPNVVLIHAGSNDMDKNVRVSTAIDRLESVVRAAHDGSPNATIFLAQLIVSNSVGMQERTDAFNPQISALVGKLRAPPNNFSIVDVNMSRILNQSEIADRKHPDDLGYSLMARAWYDAIANSTAQGLIVDPPPPAEIKTGLGLGLEGALLTPNITCRAAQPTTSKSTTSSKTTTMAEGTGAARTTGTTDTSLISESEGPTGANAAATSVSTTGAASSNFVSSTAWIALLLSFILVVTP